MDTRAHHEAQIKRFDSTFGGELEDAITTLAFRYGLSWFSDDQIADIRDLMIQTAADKRRRAAESRAHYAAFQARQTKETSDVA
jgi:hypothetical protein